MYNNLKISLLYRNVGFFMNVKHYFSEGAKAMLLSTFCFSAMQSLVKYTPHIGSFEHIFFRSIVGWVLCAVILKYQKISLIGKHNKLLIIRGIVGSVSMCSFFYILPRMPLGSSVALKYLSPIFTAIFAVLLLSEKLKPIQWFYFALSFLGVLLLKGFDTRVALFDMSLGIVSAVSGGLLSIIIRKIGDDDHPLVVVHYFMIISGISSGLAAIPEWHTPNMNDLVLLFGIGIVGFLAQWFMTKAYQSPDEVNYLAILRYSEAVYALIAGYFIFNETYTLLSFMGILLIFFSLILTVRLKAKAKMLELKVENE